MGVFINNHKMGAHLSRERKNIHYTCLIIEIVMCAKTFTVVYCSKSTTNTHTTIHSPLTSLQTSSSKFWQHERSCSCCQQTSLQETTFTLDCPSLDPPYKKVGSTRETFAIVTPSAFLPFCLSTFLSHSFQIFDELTFDE